MGETESAFFEFLKQQYGNRDEDAKTAVTSAIEGSYFSSAKTSFLSEKYRHITEKFNMQRAARLNLEEQISKMKEELSQN